MNTFRKYEKTYRIEMPNYPIKGKYHLAKKQESLLLKGKVAITEKMDGANTGIYKIKGQTYLQKKGSNIDTSHPQFRFFANEWYYNNKDKIDKLPDNMVYYGELLRCVHTVFYNKLPDWWLVFDIYDLNKQKYLSWDEVVFICKEAGLCTVPFLYEGRLRGKDDLLKLMPTYSKYGDVAEGIVVKNYCQQVRGKFVKQNFLKSIEEIDIHWLDRKIRLNEVDK